MTINNKQLGVSNNPVNADPNPVLPKLIDHNTTEQSFQEGMDDLARQVDRNQEDLGYDGDITSRTDAQANSVHSRLVTLEDDVLQGSGSIGSTNMDGDVVGDISGTFADPQINPLAVGEPEIASNAIRTRHIMDDQIMGDAIADEQITHDHLADTLSTYQITTGTDQASAVNVGDDITIPLFSQDQDGVADGPAMSESTDMDTNLYVLGSDNNWHRLNEFTRHGNTVPAAEVASTATGHVTTAAIPAGTEPTTFLAMGANRLEGMPPMQYGLEVGDFINLTNTTPDPDQQSAFVYIGPPLAAGADGMASDFVPLGQAENFGFASGGAIEFEAGTRNLQLTSTIPGARTFSGAVTASMGVSTTNLAVSGNTDLGDAATDTVTFNGTVDSNIIPEGTSGGRALGSPTARWDVFADSLDVSTLTGTVGDTNIAEDSLSVNRLNPAGMAAQVPTINPAGDEVQWMDPPIGVEMVTALPMLPDTTYPMGVLVSLTQADGDNVAGIYRSSAGDAWVRLGTVNMILSTETVRTTASTTSVTFNMNISAAHFITVNGLVLTDVVDYSVNTSNRARIDLTSSIGSGLDVVLHNFGDVASLGAGEVMTSALAPGVLPTGVTIPGGQVTSAVAEASRASSASSTNTFQIGGWTIAENASGGLDFNRGTDTLFRITSTGAVEADADITAFSDDI